MEPDLITNHSTAVLGPDSPREVLEKMTKEVIPVVEAGMPKQVTILRVTDQMKELQTNIRDV